MKKDNFAFEIPQKTLILRVAVKPSELKSLKNLFKFTKKKFVMCFFLSLLIMKVSVFVSF